MQCQLFDTLVLPILSYASDVWGVDEKAGAAAEQLHRQFLKPVPVKHTLTICQISVRGML